MRTYKLFAAMALLCMAPSFLLADSVTPGDGGSDPLISEGVVNTGFGSVTSGTVVICEFGASCVFSLSNTSGWSDVLMFYDDAHGPFSNAVYGTADKAVLFSDDQTGFYSLANYLANTKGLSGNGLVGAREDAQGNWVYGSYFGNSPEGVPEPASVFLFGTVAAAVAGLIRKKLS
jgi:hypothetical protein